MGPGDYSRFGRGLHEELGPGLGWHSVVDLGRRRPRIGVVTSWSISAQRRRRGLANRLDLPGREGLGDRGGRLVARHHHASPRNGAPSSGAYMGSWQLRIALDVRSPTPW